MADPKRLRKGMLVAAGALFAIGAALFATAPEPEGEAADASATAAALEVIPIRVEERPLLREVQKSGVLEARRQLELISETRGRVLELGADELDRVAEGQLLVRVDPTLAEVALERAEAALTRAESQHRYARRELERWSELAERDAGSIARREESDNAERVARANLREARAALVEARDQLAKKSIAAPFAGVLRDLPVEVGEYLQEGKRIGELLDLATARVVVGLADREVVAVHPGQRADVEIEALPDRTFQGAVVRVGAAADPVTRKFPAEIELANDEGRLLPGMVARVSLTLGEPTPALLVPRDATLDLHGLRYVYVIEAGGEGGETARRRRVELRSLPFQPSEYEVLAGLEAGERIAGSRLRELRDGVPVRGQAGGAPIRDNGASSEDGGPTGDAGAPGDGAP